MAADPAFAPVPSEPDHVALEHRVLERWDREGTFEQLRRKNAGGPTYSFIDGPITANNPMGVHHAWGRSLKDLFQRYHAALGEDERYQNGFDCQGLWVEVEVEKALGLNSKHEIEEYGLDRFARACRDRVAEFSGVQTEQSRRLGMWMDWERSYYTMTDPNISYIWGFLKVCHERGWLYRGHRPMVWCLRCGTSLSQHEVTATDSYRDIVDPSLYVRFRFTDAPGEALVVWTTTPWTLPANVAATVKPDAEYVWVEHEGERHVVAEERCEAVFGAGAQIVGNVRGAELVGRPYATGFDDLPAQAEVAHHVVADAEIVLDEGTGIVHIAPGCGAEDYEIGRREELPVLVPVDEAGLFVEGYGELTGHGAHDVPELVVAHLERGGWLVRQEPYEHRYPHCWRCATKLIFRVVDEWFIRSDEIRQPMIEANLTVEWTPAHFGKRMEDWLRNMGDWCISRKRYWGLPLPFWFCPDGHLTVVASQDGAARARHRRPRRAGRAAPAVDRPGHDRLCRVRRGGGAGARGRRLLAGRRHHPVLDARLRPRQVRAGGLRGGRRRRPDEGRPARSRLLGEVVPGRLDLGDARADPALVLLAALHVGRAARQGALPARARLREAARRDRPRHAQVLGQRDLVRRRHRADRRRRHALDVRRAGPRAEHELRLRGGQRRRRAHPEALEHVQVPRPERQSGGLPAALGRGRPRARERAPARPLGDRARRRARARLPCRAGRLRHAQHDARPSRPSGTTSRTGTCAARASASGRATARPSRPCTTRSCSACARWARSPRSCARRCGTTWSRAAAAPMRRPRCTSPATRSSTRRASRPACWPRWPTCARSASSGTARAPRPSCACASRWPPWSWAARTPAAWRPSRRSATRSRTSSTSRP